MRLDMGTSVWKRQTIPAGAGSNIPSGVGSGSIPSIPPAAASYIPAGAAAFIPNGVGGSSAPTAAAAATAAPTSSAGSPISGAQSIGHTFSSWSTCMEKSYCKWPAIIGCVVGGLIVLSIVWCFVRCCCCGMSFCCGCFSCCNACCGSGGRHGKGKKYADDPHPYHNQPIAPAVLAPQAGAPASAYRSHVPPAAEPPQYASFDVSRKGASDKPGGVHEDALPAMPSWETASTRKVLEEVQPPPKGSGDDMELGAIPARKAVGARGPGLSPAAAQGGYGEPGMHSLVGTPYGDPRGRGRGRGTDGYGMVQNPTVPFGGGQTKGGYSRLDSPVSPAYGAGAGRGDQGYGQGRGDQQRGGPGGNFGQDPYARGGQNGMNNQANDNDYFGADAGFPPPGRQNTGGFGATQMPMAGPGYGGGASTRSPPPAYTNGGPNSRSAPPMGGQNMTGFNSRSPPPMAMGGQGHNNNGYDNFQPQPVQRSNTGGGGYGMGGGPGPQNMGPPQRQNTRGNGFPAPQRQNTAPYSQEPTYPSNTRSPPPPQRSNTGGGYSQPQQQQQSVPNFSRRSPPRSPTEDLPSILTAGPKPVSPPPQPFNQGPSYRAYTPPAATPAYAAYKPPQQQPWGAI